jgi:TfoX/Sxy family transcriptional regulator of competence genes
MECAMAFDETLAKRVRHQLARRKNVAEKKMFGGIGVLYNGNLLVGIRKDSLLVRIDPDDTDAALREPHVSIMRMSGRGAMKGWIFVAIEGLKTDDALKSWIQRSLKFVRKLPARHCLKN